ncbi:hypothetical protein ACFWX1_47535, partial [Amycolatopsis sp. NPDC059021]
MSVFRGLTRPLVVSSMIGAVLLGSVSAASATVAAPASAPAHRAWGPLGALTDLAVQRILLGDKVAAAKFGTDQPIDDPVREQKVLDSVRQLWGGAGGRAGRGGARAPRGDAGTPDSSPRREGRACHHT